MQVLRTLSPAVRAQARAVTAAAPEGAAACGPHDREPCVPCLLAQLAQAPAGGFEVASRRVAPGTPLFREGEPLQFLYAVRSGTFKVSISAREGVELVAAFRMSGELLGLDALAEGRHGSTVTALEDGEVAAMPAAGLQAALAARPELGQAFWTLLSRELVRDKKRLLLLGTLKAEERVAAFLLTTAGRMAERGGRSTVLHLPMTRADIGSYLGLTLETVSRILHRFEKRGLLLVRHRHIEITAPERLRAFFGNKAVS